MSAPRGTANVWPLSGSAVGLWWALASAMVAPAHLVAEEELFADALFVDAGVELGRHTNGRAGQFHFAEMMGAGVALLDVEGDGDLDLLILDGTPLPGSPTPQPPSHGARLYRNDGAPTPGGPPKWVDVTAQAGLAAANLYGFGIATGDADNDGDVDFFLANLGADQYWRNRGDGSFEEKSREVGVGDPAWGSAATFFDFDRDGHLDLFLANYVIAPLEAPRPCFARSSRRDYCGPQVFRPEPNRLWRNRGDGTFTDVTQTAGLGLPSGQNQHALPSLGAAAFDADRDGWLDLYVANDGTANELWRNRRDGTFEEIAMVAGVAVNADGQPEASMGVAVGDVDEDGDEDLFLTHLSGEKNTLYLNLGGFNFEDRSARFGLAAPSLPFTSFGTAWLDLDHDGWRDLVTVSGAVRLLDDRLALGDNIALGQKKQLFHNLRGQKFEDWSERGGPSFNRLEVSRGLAVGDVDNDGDLDLLVGNNGEAPRLLLRSGAPAQWFGLRLVTGRRDALGAWVEVLRTDNPGAPPSGAPSVAPATWHRRVATDGSYGAASDPRLVFAWSDGAAPRQVRVIWPDQTRELFPVPPLGRYSTLVQGQGRQETQP